MGTPLLMGAGGAGAAVLWLDHFTGTDGTLLTAHTPDVGSGGYTAAQGTIEILGNQATGNTLSTHNIATFSTGQADVTFTATLNITSTVSSPTFGFVARYTGLSAFVTAYFDVSSGVVDIFDNGTTFTTVASAAFAFTTGSYAVKAVFLGSSVSVYVNGTLIVSATVTQNQTTTTHGIDLFGNTHNSTVDDLRVTHP